jgi:hypothetical protein
MNLFLISLLTITVAANDHPLKMVLEVSRHGARESKMSYDWAKNPAENFRSFYNLTWFGK